ncbi:hypothetical protein [Microbacterium sp. No. 7]|uniref:hypothetical protein n=1 Tax=Microbacterium sp. No. 7 TaxID=1714373 RepID=UPI0006CFDED0|nr:hypothetical protein [Microbacterium sp. No. 7]ALJ19523.1 hypothetical protein AOA12_06215 [Microbacterium sp. No. 7]
MTHWNGDRPGNPDEWAEKITKVAIERSDDPLTPWHIWGRDYETGAVTEDVWDFPTFTEAVAAIPAFFAERAHNALAAMTEKENAR